ncbi:ABC transporter substrate-binding protein [Rhodobacter sp. 24-YEA-8]|uniref:ABC transporter substrate-binding protein n=1 Tax=Rhodobacter sp. 24-YEA-8 TaxID=1884310 RepID=UPI0008982B5A|nr:ABC transporter substrate-binding protein [Rhodobacter sp. 24-YEA-8]SEC72247.1 glycine betaine/proline transport system substrate-binding protein [Rhodobacter sp. 24-YEA-8]
MTKKSMNAAVSLLALAAMAGGPALAADPGAVDEPIKLAMLEWTGAQISAQIAGKVLEKAGYKVDYVTAGNYPHFQGLADGDIAASVEIWLNNVGDVYPKVLAEGKVEDIGSLGLTTNEGWLYPKFMEELCPALPSWEALNDPECVALLATPDTLPNGRFLDYPADWGSRAATIILDNNLPLTAVPSGSEGAQLAELRAAAAAKTPLVMMFWAPHFILAEVETGWIEMPPCKDQSNEHCIMPPDVNKVVWSGFAPKWPAAYEILKAFEITTEDQQKMMLAIDEKGQSLDLVTTEWVTANEAIWRPWLDQALN